MTPTIGKVVTFVANGKEYRLRYNNRAWNALGVDPYKGGGTELQKFIESLSIDQTQRLIWAGLLWENKTLKYEDIVDELLDNLDPSSFTEFLTSFGSTYGAGGQTPASTSDLPN